ncbi:MAG: transglutaminase-like cysteine peptidase [Bacteroidota bacterium]
MRHSNRSFHSRQRWGFMLGYLCLLSLFVADTVTVYSQGTGIDLAPAVIRSAEKKYGSGARRRLENWQQLLNSARNKPESEKLQLVNDFFNQIPFISDREHWGKNDYWATPVEMLASNGGDCEDFAIGKYFTLLALNVPIEKLKIAYVKTRDPNPINRSHTVLTYYSGVDDIPWVLDNLSPEIKLATQRTDLIPVYSFNGAGLWLAKEHGEGRRVSGGSGNISLWRDLTARMGREFDL